MQFERYAPYPLNGQPIIGMLVQPGDTPEMIDKPYLAGSYVKLFESSGCRVVPILCDASYAEIDALLGKVNGVVLTGGWAKLLTEDNKFTPFMELTKYIINLSLIHI